MFARKLRGRFATQVDKCRKNVVDITEKIYPIDFGDTVLFNAFCKVDIAKDYLIVSDYKNYENQVHLFDKNNFHYLFSIHRAAWSRTR